MLGIKEDTSESKWSEFQWCAPRMLLQYFKEHMKDDVQNIWSADNYDGLDILIEDMMLPRGQYRTDTEPTVVQQREFRATLVQL